MHALLGRKLITVFALIYSTSGVRPSSTVMTTKRIIGIYEIPGAKDPSDSISNYIKIIVEYSEESICTYSSSEESIPSRVDDTDHPPAGVERPTDDTITEPPCEGDGGEVKHPLVRRHTFPEGVKEQQCRAVHDGEEPCTERS